MNIAYKLMQIQKNTENNNLFYSLVSQNKESCAHYLVSRDIKTYTMTNNTYIQSNKFKNYKFSEGEELTEMDLECIASRSKRSYQQDPGLESYLSEEYSSVIYVRYEDTELFDEENMDQNF